MINSETKQTNKPVIVSYCKLTTECSHWWSPVLQNHLSLKNMFSSYSGALWIIGFELWIFWVLFPKGPTWRLSLEMMSCLNSEPSSAMMLITGKSKTREGGREPVWWSTSWICLFKSAVALNSTTTQTALPAPCFFVSSSCAFLSPACFPEETMYYNPVAFLLWEKIREETGRKVTAGVSLQGRGRLKQKRSAQLLQICSLFW